MSKVIKLKKGFNISLVGEAAFETTKTLSAATYAIKPDDFEMFIPKLLVKVGDKVKAGTPLLFDKNNPEVLLTSPVSGTVSDIVRGAKRKLLSVLVEADKQQECETFETKELSGLTRDDVKQQLLKSGLWPMIIQRPYGIVASSKLSPKAIFVSGFDSSPLAPDYNYILSQELDNLNAGFAVLSKLTDGKVHLSLLNGTKGVPNEVSGVEKHVFEGKHPAGNVGVQIHHIDPVNKGENVWTVNIQDVAIIGRLFNTGRVDMSKTVVLTGSELVKPQYAQVIIGAKMDSIIKASDIKTPKEDYTVRIINGNVLTGKTSSSEDYLSFYNNQITVIPEGDKFELLGWAMPRFNKLSVSRNYFSWLMPKKKYALDTNLNGGNRAFVVTGLFECFTPMDIYPLYLLKAILAKDVEKMENLGIYEILEEDLALCEFVDPSKTEIQQIVREGLNLMIKEFN
ncbi:MAG: Na(+)-translocating NADH-quinone reductase subunit A [Rikenellaceae bacterium]